MQTESTPTLIVTFIRHGESTDNLRSVWAGWKDAPLSNHGMNQAKALGESLATTPFEAIYASPLKRALWTGQAVRDAQPDPKPPLHECPDIREQHWGVAEGKPWVWNQKPGLSIEEHFARDIWPVLHERWQHFPEGESLDMMYTRAKRAVDECVMPHVWKAAREGRTGVHIALASHGLCISELIPALLAKDDRFKGTHMGAKYRGLLNTAWTRLTIEVEGAKDGEPLVFGDDSQPRLRVSVMKVNQHQHLTDLTRQGGGIGRAAYDPNQKGIRAFFGGGKVSDAAEPELEEGRSLSNAKDEAEVEIN